MLSRWTSFLRRTEGVSAVEFALITPALLLFLGGAVELSGGITAGNRATYVAESIGQVVSQTQGPITASDMQGFLKSASIVDPDIIAYARATGKSLETAVNVTVSSVLFKQQLASCTQNCAYDAFVVFSEALSGPKRSCGKLTPSDTAGPSTLPPGVYSPSSLVVLDVETFYRPMMTTLLGSEISFKRTLYFRPRYVDHVNYANNCAGYPVD